jgi:hypothetical protein
MLGARLSPATLSPVVIRCDHCPTLEISYFPNVYLENYN